MGLAQQPLPRLTDAGGTLVLVGLPSQPQHQPGAGGAPLELAWLRERVRQRLEREQGLEATVALRDPSAAQREAVGRLLGRRVRPVSTLRVRLREVSVALAGAGLAEDVGAAVVALDGPVEDLAGQRRREGAAWAVVSERVEEAVARRPELEPWAVMLRRTGLLRALGRTPGAADRLLSSALAVIGRLPADGVRLASFASAALGDAHALDVGRPVETLALGAVRALVGEPVLAGAEARRESWAAAGVLVDDLTTQVLVLGLPGGGRSPADRVLDAGREAGEVVVLTLGMLTRHPPQLPAAGGLEVSVCENVTVLAEAVDRLGASCAPLVCTRGQPTVAVIRLLGLLVVRGARLRYHGDFDWGGVRIANRVFRRVGFTTWRFETAAYRAAAARGGPALDGTPVQAAWDPHLAQAMRAASVKVEEEAVLDALIADLHR